MLPGHFHGDCPSSYADGIVHRHRLTQRSRRVSWLHGNSELRRAVATYVRDDSSWTVADRVRSLPLHPCQKLLLQIVYLLFVDNRFDAEAQDRKAVEDERTTASWVVGLAGPKVEHECPNEMDTI